MEPSHDHIEKTLDKLVASTRSPRGRYSASESWKLLERRLVPPRTKRLRLFRLAGAVAASVLLCFASWFIYDYWKPVAMQTVSAGAAISVITLPDQTKVTLNRYSSLTYPDRFKEDRREVQLQGEAYFEVAKCVDRPFIVNANGMRIRVLGTSFNVRAYEGEERQTTLVEGCVEVAYGEQRVKINPGQQVALNNGHLEVRQVDIHIYSGWKSGRFVFEDHPLAEVLRELERWYDVQIVVEDERVEQLKFTSDFPRYEDIDKVLDIIELATCVKFEVRGRTITVRMAE